MVGNVLASTRFAITRDVSASVMFVAGRRTPLSSSERWDVATKIGYRVRLTRLTRLENAQPSAVLAIAEVNALKKRQPCQPPGWATAYASARA